MKTVQYIFKSTLLKICNIKMITFGLVILVNCWTYNRALRDYSRSVDYPVSWVVFPFMMSMFTFLILFWFGIVYINSDIPFMQHSNIYHILRAGRKRWAIGQLGGIWIRSFVIVLFTVICSILSILPRIEWSNEWGKVLRTITTTSVAHVHEFRYSFYYEIFSVYSGNFFVPSRILGINANSNHKDKAKSFLRYCITEGSQDVFASGFSINRESFKNSMPVADEVELVTIYYENMEATDGLSVYSFTTEDFSQVEEFIEKLDTTVLDDRVILACVMEQAQKYLYEGVALESAVNAAFEKIDLYLKE